MKLFQWEEVTRANNEPYMWRLILIRCWFFRLYFHIFLGSDDFCQHDHPWNFISLILWGGYWEVTNKKIWYAPGAVLFRKANWQHQVVIDKPCYTLVLCLNKTREWGFHTPLGWVYHRFYSHARHCS